ncbi:MAG: OsmC family protein [Proteobacteria bacterium]|nr:OsmC family protein [Pseudomonadota bacterium]
MHAEISHKANFTFETKIRDHKFYQDTQLAAGGENKGPTPKELLLAGIIGCAGMDVVGLLKKHKMTAESLNIQATAEPRKEHPRVFQAVEVVFTVSGVNIGPEELKDSVKLSLTKYCGVSAMVSKVVPIQYRVILNGIAIDEGKADFGL